MTNPLLPSLGSDLLSQARSKHPPPLPLKTSFEHIDTAIPPIKYGRITNIQCEVGGHGTLLSHHLLTTHLLTPHPQDPHGNKPPSQVAYVDTTGSFSAVNLLKVLELRLSLLSQQGTTQEVNTHGGQIRKRAVELLDRVQYMRTFDFDGVVETVQEVFGSRAGDVGGDGGLDGGVEGGAGINSGVMTPETRTPENEGTAEAAMEVDSAVSPAEEEGEEEEEEEEAEGEEELSERTTIPDSDADSDEEIFWPIPLLPKHDPGVKLKPKGDGNNNNNNNNDDSARRRRDIDETVSAAETAAEATGETVVDPERFGISLALEEGDKEREEISVPLDVEEQQLSQPPLQGRNFGVIIFDNISRPLENLMETGDEVEINSRLTSLSKGLKSLARDQGIAIILLSTPTTFPPNTKDTKKDQYSKNSSIFSRVQPTEGLPRTLGSCLDHTIMVSRYPKNEAMTSHRRRSGGHDRFIIEAVAERNGGGVGKWGGFMVKGDIEFVELFKE
ncbi:hypothetical protein TWF718_003321 [Orbilia javanica]|uniref:DNA recombination and repair protein Rad51-like C-terminal domain-containing protein n=1 Tax=Orbilia javanica TaxID=47235 RepID=A0AAN8R8X2_9PEZI